METAQETARGFRGFRVLSPLRRLLRRLIPHPSIAATISGSPDSPALLAQWYAAQIAAPDSIVIAGDSHAQTVMARLLERRNVGDLPEPWHKAFLKFGVQGRGIGGQTANEVSARFCEIARHEPSRLFLFVGANDITQSGHGAGVVELAGRAVREVGAGSVVLATIPPVAFADVRHCAKQNAQIVEANAQLARLATELRPPHLLDVHGLVVDSATGTLRADLTYDGVHFNTAGSDRVIDAMQNYLPNGLP